MRRVDANQTEIVQALRQAGCSVLILSDVGDGCPDILPGYQGVDGPLLEIKDGNKPANQQKLRPSQVEFHRDWRGRPPVVVRNVDEAFRVVGINYE